MTPDVTPLGKSLTWPGAEVLFCLFSETSVLSDSPGCATPLVDQTGCDAPQSPCPCLPNAESQARTATVGPQKVSLGEGVLHAEKTPGSEASFLQFIEDLVLKSSWPFQKPLVSATEWTAYPQLMWDLLPTVQNRCCLTLMSTEKSSDLGWGM